MSDKTQFIAALEIFVEHEGRRTNDGHGRPYRLLRGQVTLMRGVLQHLRSTTEPAYTSWLTYLDRFLGDAFHEIRTSERYVDLRAKYITEVEYEVPDLFEIHDGGLHRMLVVQALVRLCVVLSGCEWLQEKLGLAFNAQSAVIDQAWCRFVRVAYVKMMERINDESHRLNVGIFGTTTLTTFACAGRVVFAFERRTDRMEYVADDGDPIGIRSEPNVSSTRYDLCVSMIEEVTSMWEIGKMIPS